MSKRMIVAMMAVVLCAAMAQAGIRADLSGDAVVDFATTTDMPFVTVGNPGNAGEWSGSGDGGWPSRISGAVGFEYNIGKFEVTAGQYTEFLNAVAATDTYGLYNTNMWFYTGGCRIDRSGSSGSYTYAVAADWEDRPVNYVSWADAARFSNWLTNGMPTGTQDMTTTEDGSYDLSSTHSYYADEEASVPWSDAWYAVSDALLSVTRNSSEAGVRYVIPSEDEWYKAAYHKNDGVTGNYWDYPTGSDTTPSNVLIDPDPGNNVNFHDGTDYTIGSPYWQTEAGEFENSESPYGTFDQGGNFWEWNEAAYGAHRGMRGGSYGVYGGQGDSYLQASYRGYYAHGFAMHEYSLYGFRIAEVPEPATVSLLALGGLAMLRRRRK